MNSFNMPNLGASIGEWLFSCVGGIETDGVGFKRILIRPYIGAGLTHARASYASIHGTIAVRWEKSSGAVVIDVTIPVNTSATVSLPGIGTGPVTIEEGGRTVWHDGAYRGGVTGVFGARANADRVDLLAGSGSYKFRIKGSGP